MIITCIAASNTKLIGENSTSVKVCHLIEEMVKNNEETASVEVIPLMDYDITTCILCGACYKSSSCVRDDEFNRLFSKIIESEGIFLVVPHYSPIPAKLIMVFEKINEILYASWVNDPQFASPLMNIKVGVIGHGGMPENEEALKYYHENLVTPVANTMKSLSFQIVGLNESFPNGAVFGLKDETCLETVDGAIFPHIVQDWATIKERIKPLVVNMIQEIH